MILSRKMRLLLCLPLSILMLLSLLYIINTRLDLSPNSIMVNAVSEDNGYKAKIHLDTGAGFGQTVLKSGEASAAFLNHVESLRIGFSRPLSLEDNFMLKDYSLEDGQETSLWIAGLFSSGYEPKINDALVMFSGEPEAQYQLFVNDKKWPLTGEEGLLLAQNPGKRVQPPGTVAVLKTTAANGDIKDIRDLSFGIDYFGAVEKDTASIAIESITMERYFGRLNFYLPRPLKAWAAEEILEDFNIMGDDGSHRIEEGTLYLSSHLWLEHGEFNTACEEIQQSMVNYKHVLNMFAVVSAIIFFFLAALIFIKFERLKVYLKNIGCYVQINNKLVFLFFFSLVMLVSLPEEAIHHLIFIRVEIIKVAFFLLALASGTTILYLNRHKLAPKPQSGVINSKGHLTTTLLIIALVLGAFIFSYKLGEHDIREDEFQVVDAAGGYYYEGDYYSWDWIEGEPGENYLGESYYDRAFPHTFLIAQAYNLFGISEWSTRLVSVLFGILFIPLLYLIARFFTADKYLSLLVVYIAIFYDYHIYYFRYARMYALLLPLSLLLVYLIYKGMTESSLPGGSSNKLYELVSSRFNYNYFYAALALAVLYLGYLLHINALVIIPAAWLFAFVLLFKTKEKKYFSLALIGLAGLGCLILAYYFELALPHTGFISFFERSNYRYLEFLTRYPFPWEIGAVLLALGLVATLLTKTSMNNKLLYLYMIVLFSLFFFIFIADRYTAFKYALHIAPISIILIIYSCLLLLRAINSRIITIAFAGLLFFNVASHYYHNIDTLYGDDHIYGSHSQAYEIIIDNYDPENEVIFGQYLRDFYLQEMRNMEVETVNMLRHELYSFETFIADLQQYQAGWVTWETRKSRHLEQDIIDFIDTHFEKIHGQGVDDLKVEVYYFQLSDLHDLGRYTIDNYAQR